MGWACRFHTLLCNRRDPGSFQGLHSCRETMRVFPFGIFFERTLFDRRMKGTRKKVKQGCFAGLGYWKSRVVGSQTTKKRSFLINMIVKSVFASDHRWIQGNVCFIPNQQQLFFKKNSTEEVHSKRKPRCAATHTKNPAVVTGRNFLFCITPGCVPIFRVHFHAISPGLRFNLKNL